MKSTRFLILGGGITGLSFAAELNHSDYLIAESNDEIGGYCRTIRQDGFVWDYSGHFFHFRDPKIEKRLVDRIGPDRVRTIHRKSKIFYAGQHIDFPFQRNIHQLPQHEFLQCLNGLFDRPTTPPANFQQMLHAKFGSGITEKFLAPYNEKLYATELDRLDVDAMGRFFPHASAEEIVRGFQSDTSGSYNSTFTYPEGGAIEYVHAIARDVQPEKILTSTRVEKLDLRNKVAHTSQGDISFEYLVSSAPFPQLLSLCALPFEPSIYSHNKVLVFNLGFGTKGPKNVHWIYYPQRELSFYRVGFYDNIFDTPRMSLYVELGYRSDADLTEEKIGQAKAQVLEDLRQCGVIDQHQLVSSHCVVLDPAYVHITQSSIRDVETKGQLLAARGVYSAGRYGAWTYCSIEDNIIESQQLAQKFNQLQSAGLL